jgi:arginyl-tRNA synthetase
MSGPGRTALERLELELADAAGAALTLERPGNPAHGDYATNVALRLAPVRRRAPLEIAEELRGVAARLPEVVDAAVAEPGFLNLVLAPGWFGDALGEILEAGSDYGSGTAAAPQRIQVELVSANPTGPLTVGSARNGAYGDSVARLLRFAGHDVTEEYYFNDAGTQIDRFRASVEARRRGAEPPEDGYQGAYIDDLAAAPDDPVARMLQQIESSLERFRIHVDTWQKESAIAEEIPAALAELDTYEAEGALWARTSAYGDEKDRVLVRASGEPTYFAGDAAYIRHKLAGFDHAIYVLGADHHGYVGRLKALASMLGADPERIEVLIYQLVHLTQRGEARKMSKRRGDVVLLDSLLDEIGVDAARWYLVSRGHDQAIEIDVDLAAERSEKNPVYYVQYAHARIAGILRNAGGAPVAAEPPRGLAGEERDLIKRLAEFPAVAAEATERRAPHAVPTYAIRVADDFHRFYHHHRVLESEAQAFRLGLCKATQSVVARCLDLIGVEAPDRM